MKQLAIYLDLDGVLADFDGGMRKLGYTVDEFLNYGSHKLTQEQAAEKLRRYKHIAGTSFFEDLDILPGAVELYRFVRAADPIILTAAPKFGATEDDYYVNSHWLGAAYAKRRWVEHKLLPVVEYVDRVKAIPFADRYLSDEGLVQLSQYQVDPNTRVKIPDERFICTTSSRKQEFIHRKKSDHQILIDDRKDNCDTWRDAGGIAIQHVSAEDSIAQLKELISGN